MWDVGGVDYVIKLIRNLIQVNVAMGLGTLMHLVLGIHNCLIKNSSDRIITNELIVHPIFLMLGSDAVLS